MTAAPRLVVITPPAGEPVSIGDVKKHCNIRDAEDDGYIGGLIALVRSVLEGIQGRAFNTQTIELALDAFPATARAITLWRAPLRGVVSVVLNLADGTTKTMDPDVYLVDTRSTPGRLVLRDGESWPGDALAEANGIVITYTAGYADYVSGTVTITSASPAVVTWAAHGLSAGFPVAFTSSSAVPDGLSPDVTYYVTAVSANTFQLARIPGGPPVATTSAGSGTITARSAGRVPASILHAIKLLAAYYYEHREAANDLANLKEIPKSFDYLVSQERVAVFA